MITTFPEFRIAIFGFLTAFVWEMWQLPLYETSGMAMFDMVKGCSLASLGDAGIMVFAYAVTSWFCGSRRWLISPTAKSISFYLAAGLAVTVIVEHIALRVPFGWQYDEAMPMVPILEIGLVPALMWIIVPLVTLGLAKMENIASPID